MLKNLLPICALLIAAVPVLAQDLEYGDYSWEDEPKFETVTPEANEHEVVVLD